MSRYKMIMNIWGVSKKNLNTFGTKGNDGRNNGAFQ